MGLRALFIASGAVVALSAAFACTDLFHSTSDFKNSCELDASSLGCGEICDTNSNTALSQAETACAWLGACVGPLGMNQFGSCTYQGILALDCNANPNRPVQGDVRAFWSCMRNVASCGDVNTCVFPVATQGCAADTTKDPVCGGGTNNSRIQCVMGATFAENCLAWGEVCDQNTGTCTGEIPRVNDAAVACRGGPTCDDASIRDCTDAGQIGAFESDAGDEDSGDDGGSGMSVPAPDAATSVNRGVDCADFGAQACVVNGPVAACVGTHAPACTPSSVVTCDGNIARSCPGGVQESIDCNLLVKGPCTVGVPDPPWDLASACGAAGAGCENCGGADGLTLTSCYRGRTFEYDCSLFGKCVVVTTADGDRAQCTRPTAK